MKEDKFGCVFLRDNGGGNTKSWVSVLDYV